MVWYGIGATIKGELAKGGIRSIGIGASVLLLLPLIPLARVFFKTGTGAAVAVAVAVAVAGRLVSLITINNPFLRPYLLFIMLANIVKTPFVNIRQSVDTTIPRSIA